MHLSASVVIVQVHQRSARLLAFGSLPRVDEHLGERAAVCRVVRAARPLEAAAADDSTDATPGRARTDRRSLADRLVTATAVEGARATGTSDGVRHPRRRYSMHECHLPNTCRNKRSSVKYHTCLNYQTNTRIHII